MSATRADHIITWTSEAGSTYQLRTAHYASIDEVQLDLHHLVPQDGTGQLVCGQEPGDWAASNLSIDAARLLRDRLNEILGDQ